MGKLEDDIRQMILEQSSVAAFARKVGLPEHTLYSVLNNGLAGGSLATVIPITRGLGLDPDAILDGRIEPINDRRRTALVPFFSRAGDCASGNSSQEDEFFPIPASLHKSHPEAFLIRMEGNAMNHVFGDGSLVLVDPCTSIASSGEIYVMEMDDGNTAVRRVRMLDNGMELQPCSDDPTYHTMVLDNADPTAARISPIGRVVWYCAPIN